MSTRCIRPIASALGIAASLLCTGANAATAEQILEQARLSASTNRLIVKLRPTPTGLAQPMSGERINTLVTRAGQGMRVLRPTANGAHVMLLEGSLPNESAAQLAQRVAQDPQVEYAQPDYRMQRLATANDPFFSQQTYLGSSGVAINATTAWDRTVGGSVVVAVLDTGIVPHADIDPTRILAGYDFISADTAAGNTFVVAGDGDGRDAFPTDPGDRVKPEDVIALNALSVFSSTCDEELSSWHGTKVASVIAATTNNGLDIAGVNRNARILPIRVLGRCGGFTSDIMEAARWAAGLHVEPGTGEPAILDNLPANRAQILNLSLGVDATCGNFEQSVINEILAAGVVKAIVAAAGNRNTLATNNAPGNCAGVVNVAGVLANGSKAGASNYGSAVTVAAPYGGVGSVPDVIFALGNTGTDTVVASPGGDQVYKVGGTSFAAPLVSGTVSLMLSVNPNLTASQVYDTLRLTSHAFPLGSSCRSLGCGSGTIDAAAAVAMAENNPPAARTFPDATTAGPLPGGGGGGSSSGGGGGGCALAQNGSDASLLLLLLAMVGYRVRRRR